MSRIAMEEVDRAAERIGPHTHVTPTLSSRRIGEMAGIELWLKAECLQKTGSFKPRGAINRLETLTDAQRAAGVVTVSAGNHAQGLAYAAGRVGVDCTVVMPDTAPQAKVAASRSYGAEVILHGTVTDAFALALEIAESGRTLAHPYDDPMVIAGQGTLAREFLSAVPDPEVVVVPIGGGGLISGVATVCEAVSPSTRVIGVEPRGAATMTAALDAGEPVAIVPETLADGLSAPIAGEHTMAIVDELVEQIVLVDEDEIAQAMGVLAAAAKLVTEGSGAAAVAALLAGRIDLRPGARVVAVCSGGNIDLTRFAELVGGGGAPGQAGSST